MVESMLPFYALAIAGAAIIICLFYKYFELLRRFQKNEFVQYVDRTGIAVNPPAYIDLMEGKTINFKLGKRTISIAQLRPEWCFKYLRKISANFKVLSAEADKGSSTWNDKVVYGAVYLQTAYAIYELSKYFVRDRGAYKKELLAKAKTDVVFILNICEQVLDYWFYVKKKLQLLAQGKTFLQMAGVRYSDKSCKLELDGTLSALPRFESGSSSVH